MKFYTLDVILMDAIGVPTSVVIDLDKIDDHTFYEKNITNDKFLKGIAPIYLKLVQWTGTPHKLRDYHFWDAGSPNAYLIVCSQKLRAILETFNLPPHCFYNCEIRVKQKTYNYFILHFLQDWNKAIDYQKSVFDVIAYMDNNRLVKRLNAGEVKSFSNYEDISEMLLEVQQELRPAKLHFLPHINYDIWGLYSQIILSEKAKQAILDAKITGVEMPEMCETISLKNIEIVMNGQTYISKPQTKVIQYENKLDVLNLVAEQETLYNKKQ